MYRRPKFLEILDEVRQEMSREADYDVDLFAELIRNGLKNKVKVQDNEFVAYQNKSSEEFAPKTKK